MATAKNDLLKMLKGKIGDCVIYQSRGKTCMRLRPESFRPSSAGQVAQQRRIASISSFYRAVKDAGLFSCWQNAQKQAGWTGYNLFLHKNLPAFSAGGLISAPEKIRLTLRTGLELPDEPALEKEAEGRWMLTWKNATGYPGCNGNDRMVVVLMCGGRYFDVRFPDNGEGIACREDERGAFVLPTESENYTHVYCFMRSADGSRFSDSMYMGNLS